jgi:DNA-binding IclR family transcriptional regulator
VSRDSVPYEPAPAAIELSATRDGVRAVEQAAALLHAFTPSEPQHGARDLAERFGMTKSTVQRILASLESTGLLDFDERTRRYSLGVGLLRIAGPFLRDNDLVQAARGPMTWLRDLADETVTLSIAVRTSRMTISELESSYELRFATVIGHPYSLRPGVIGRVLLAGMDKDELEWTIAAILREEANDDHSRGQPQVDEATLRSSVAQAAADGYATSPSEWLPGATGVAVPVRWNDRLVAALSLYGPDIRMTSERVVELLPALKTAASEISLRVARRSTEHDD